MAAQLKLPYGLRDGELLHIGQVATGLACGCTCPGCGARLVARNAAKNVKVAHFAHYKAVECSTGLQTALHLAAKDIIARHRQLRLPGVSGYFRFTEAYRASFTFDIAPYEDCLFDSVGFNNFEFIPSTYDSASRYAFPSQLITVDEVVLEKRTGDIVPDVLVRTGQKWLLVEVAVTHFVEAEKLAKIKALGVSALEIDLSSMPRTVASADLEALIIEGDTYKKWLSNPPLRAVLRQRRHQYFELCRPELERQHAEYLRHEARQAARARWQAELAAKSPEERARIERSKPAFYRNYYRSLTKRNVGQTLEPVWHVDGCPKAARLYDNQPYANVTLDCFICQAFRGFNPDRTAVVCLHDYPRRKSD